jgi:hypothetical protein
MGGTGKNNEPRKTEDKGKSKLPPAALIDDENREDGDFATPKRDRDDDDDQPA